MNNQLREPIRLEEDEVSLLDLGRILARYKLLLIGVPLLAALIATTAVLLIKPIWEATALIQIGQVGMTGGSDKDRFLVEPPPRAVERMKLKSFEDAVLAKLNIPLRQVDPDPRAELFRNSLKVKQLPNTDLIQLKVRGRSPEEAAQWTDAIVALLREAHQKIAEPTIVRLNRQYEETTKDLQRIKSERERLLQNITLQEQVGPGNRFAENVLFASILTSKDSEIRELEQRKLALEETLSSARTYPTSVIDRVYVPEKAVFPRKTSTVILSALFGVIAAVLAAFVLNYVRQDKAARG